MKWDSFFGIKSLHCSCWACFFNAYLLYIHLPRIEITFCPWIFQYFGEKKSSCEHFFSHSPCCLLKLWSGRAMLVRNPSLIFKCGNRNLKTFSSSVDNPGTHKYSSLGIDANSITLFTSNSSRNRNLTRVSDKFSIMAVTAFLIQGDWYDLLESFFTIWILIVLIN